MIYSYRDKQYPTYLKNGHASRFISEFAKEFCVGTGINIGYGDKEGKIFEKNCTFLDIKTGQNCNYLDIDDNSLDYIFSSHTLEHLDDWKKSIVNWISKLKIDGVLFLYLPHPDMEYWRKENCTKHKYTLFPDDIQNFCKKDLNPLFATGRDLYWSYSVVGFKTQQK